jgi:peptidoglycan/LPS O-acetylase OafA/YrhL
LTMDNQNAGEVKKYEFIDALRGYAILAVIAVHCAQVVGPGSSHLHRLMDYGARGVQLFYVASALTLGMSWQQRRFREHAPLRNFLLRRFFRIAPMFYVAVLFYSCLYGLGQRYWAPNGISWWYVPLTMLFLNGYHPESITSVVPGGWSIAVEMNFYLILPLLIARIESLRGAFFFIGITLLLSAAANLALWALYSDVYPSDQRYLLSGFLSLNFFTQLPIFAIGIAAFLALDAVRITPTYALIAACSLLSAVALMISMPVQWSTNLANIDYLFFGMGFGIFALVLYSYPTAIITNPVVVQLGKLSFSMYLSHFAVIHYLRENGISDAFGHGNLRSLGYLAWVLCLTALVSYFFYRVVEQPMISLGRQLITRLEKTDLARSSKASLESSNVAAGHF